MAGGLLSWFAFTHPDGLEWSIKGVTGKEEVEAPKAGAHGVLASLQEKLAFLPDYDFRKPEGEAKAKKAESWPDVNPGKSLAGVLGAVITLLLVGAIGFGLKSMLVTTADPGFSRGGTPGGGVQSKTSPPVFLRRAHGHHRKFPL